MLEAKDLIVGHCYSAKRSSVVLFRGINDRMILHIGAMGDIQYDSPTVKPGRRFPTVTAEAFLKWAKEDVTDQMPPDDWRQ
jgi:hypothetical protein